MIRPTVGPDREPRRSRLTFDTKKKLLLTLTLLGLLLTIVGSTLATFTATTTNPANVFSNATVTMTNVAGTVISGTNCSTPTSNGTCATLFGAGNAGSLMPGGADVTNTVTITYTGTVTPTSDFRLYSANYSSKLGSSPASCTAANPGSALDLQVSVGTLLPVVIYPTSGVGYGTIDGFATTYTSSANGLQLRGGTNGVGAAGVWATNDNSIFNIKVHLDGTAATNPYQGCQSQVDVVWFASQ